MDIRSQTGPTIPRTDTEAPKRYFFIFLLLFLSQRIPNSFFEVAVPALLRESGASLEQIGLLRLLSLVVIIKLLIAPLVDNRGSSRFGHYKTWIVPLQLMIFSLTLVFVTIDMVNDFALFVALAFVWLLLFGVQDVAVDGLTIKSFSRLQYPTINAIQTMMVTIGGLIGGLVVLITAKYGFNFGVVVASVAVLLPLSVLYWLREKTATTDRASASPLTVFSTLQIPGVKRWLVLLIILAAGPSLSSGMISPMLIDQGFDLASIGQLFGISYPVTGMVSVLVTPILIRWLGQHRTLSLAALCLILDALILIYIHAYQPSKWIIFVLLNFGAFTNVILLISIYSITMAFCRKSHAATDWTVMLALFGGAGSLFGAAGGFVAGQVGYAALFSCSLVLVIFALIVISRAIDLQQIGLR